MFSLFVANTYLPDPLSTHLLRIDYTTTISDAPARPPAPQAEHGPQKSPLRNSIGFPTVGNLFRSCPRPATRVRGVTSGGPCSACGAGSKAGASEIVVVGFIKCGYAMGGSRNTYLQQTKENTITRKFVKLQRPNGFVSLLSYVWALTL